MQERGACLCGGSDFDRPYPNQLDWLWRCRECGQRFTFPQPTDDELADIYDGGYFETFGYSERNGEAYRAMARRRAAELLRTAERDFPPGRLLDVGSGLGDLLSAAGARGWTARGVEANPYAVEMCGEDAAVCSIEDFKPDSSGRFDLITCIDVIEHLRRPDIVLRKLHRLLHPGGGLLVTTPDVRSLASRLAGRRWPHYHRDHLWYFHRQGLRRLVEDAGFEIIRCGRAKKVFTLSYLLNILSRHERSAAIRTFSRWALKGTPRWFATRPFRLREGLIVIARRREEWGGDS